MNLGDQIHGWKEIGSYIGRTARTARRWEVERKLPVRRMPGSGRSSVYAIKSELDQWLVIAPPLGEDSDADASPAFETDVPPTAAQITLVEVFRSRLTFAMVAGSLLLALIPATAYSIRRASRHGLNSTSSSSRTTAVPGVNELYLRGREQYELRTMSSVKAALQLFSEATARDPKFAPAWASLGNAYTVLGEYEAINNLDAYAKARDAAERALALDPSLAEPHANLGFLDYFRVGDVALAEQEFRTALALDPKCAMAHSWFGTVLANQGRLEEATQEFDQAAQIEPHSIAILAGRALAIGLNGRREEGFAILQKLNRESPNPMVAHHLSVLATVEPRNAGLFLRSKTQIAQMENVSPAALALYASMEKAAASQPGGDQAVWKAIADKEVTNSLLQAEAQAALGKNDAAFAILDTLTRQPGPSLGIRSDPMLTSLHKDTRWPSLVSRDGRTWSPQ